MRCWLFPAQHRGLRAANKHFYTVQKRANDRFEKSHFGFLDPLASQAHATLCQGQRLQPYTYTFCQLSIQASKVLEDDKPDKAQQPRPQHLAHALGRLRRARARHERLRHAAKEEPEESGALAKGRSANSDFLARLVCRGWC